MRQTAIALLVMEAPLAFAAASTALAAAARYRHGKLEAKRALTHLRYNLKPEALERMTDMVAARVRETDDAVAAVPPGEATFENTAQRLIDLDVELGPTIENICVLKEVSPDDGVRAASRRLAERLSEVDVEHGMRADVLAVLKRVQADPGTRTREQRRYLERTVRDFERNGLHLPEETRKQVEGIKKAISQKSLRFLANLGEDSSEVLVDEADLSSMDSAFVQGLEQRDGKRVVTMSYPHVLSIMDRCGSGETRRRVSTAFNSRCISDNVPLLEECVALRHQLANLLGYKTHAQFQLDVSMAKSQEAVHEFLASLRDKLLPAGAREREALLALKREDCEARGEPFDGELRMWDLRFYQRMWKEREYEVDMQEVKQFFPVQVVVRGMLATYQQVMGLRFDEVQQPHVWHPDVRMYSVSDGLSGEPMGYFYLDLHPRPGKYTHACCMPLQSSCLLPDGTRRLGACALIANFTKPTQSAPSLLGHDEVETLFHEFGHGVHALCARPDLPRFSAFSVEWDFVEAPSQMLENWVYERAPLRFMSGHVDDPERKIPDSLIHKLARAKHANVALFTLRQLTFALFDQEIHSREEARTADTYARLVKECTGVEAIPGTNFAAGFGHMAGGYDAKYYGYLWSKVLAQDFWDSVFKQDCMNSTAGRRYRTTVLEPGGTVDAMDMVRTLLGREPSHAAFLRECGLEA